MGANERFEQRIAGETIRAMQAGAGDLADRVEARDFRFAIHVGEHAAALVMGGRDDRDRFLRDVNAVTEAGLVDVREAFDDERGGLL